MTVPGTLTVAHFTGGSWSDEGNGGTTGSATSGTITSASNLTSFSPVTLATTNDADNPLPIELVSFTGTSENNIVKLDWATASEFNNDRFEVLRSLDQSTFEVIGIVGGNGNTNELVTYSFVDNSPAPGANYYRLNQIDYDGTSELHPIIKVDNNFFMSGVEAIVYPNPVTGKVFNVAISTGDNHTPVLVELIDISGQTYFSENVEPGLKMNVEVNTSERLASGIYFLQINQGDNHSKVKVIVK